LAQVAAYGAPESKSDSLERVGPSGVSHLLTKGQIDSTGRKTAIAATAPRAEALTRLARKVDVLTLAKISGHKDLRILQNAYYREAAAEIAARL
jgi:integrase